MYVQEYDWTCPEPNRRRVYIAYLDSVEYFRPRSARTKVYHEIIVSYLLWCRLRGFQHAHIWACPPHRGNNFIFWCHPQHQKTPSKERLLAWYRNMLKRARELGVVHRVSNFYDEFFEKILALGKTKTAGHLPACPPMFEGDFWTEEALRLNYIIQKRAATLEQSTTLWHLCEALLKKLLSHSSATPFLVPVDPIAHHAPDYHVIITQPMDLGTVMKKLRYGEYGNLRAFRDDVLLVFTNAFKYNPPQHVVHELAKSLQTVFDEEYNALLCRCLGGQMASKLCPMNDDSKPGPITDAMLETLRLNENLSTALSGLREESLCSDAMSVDFDEESTVCDDMCATDQAISGEPDQTGCAETNDAHKCIETEKSHVPESRNLPYEISRSVQRLKSDLIVLDLQRYDNEQSGDSCVCPPSAAAASSHERVSAVLASIHFGDTTDPVSRWIDFRFKVTEANRTQWLGKVVL